MQSVLMSKNTNKASDAPADKASQAAPLTAAEKREAAVNSPLNWTLSPHKHTVGYLGAAGPAVHLAVHPNVHHTEYHWYKTPTRYALINITELAEAVLARSGVYDGFLFISAMHITAGMYINDAEMGLLQDISALLTRLAPFREGYKHHGTGEDNGDAHLKSLLVQHEVTVPVTGGRLDFGTWQQVFMMEGDGLRKKRIMFKATGISTEAAEVALAAAGKKADAAVQQSEAESEEGDGSE